MKAVALCMLVVAVVGFTHVTASAPIGKPEDAGVSPARLQRISEMLERRIAAGDLAGAVSVVARRGVVVHHAAQGVMDLQSKPAMTEATMFRIASMTKPLVGAAIMMLGEEGRLRLNDPVSRYIPEFREMKVGANS